MMEIRIENRYCRVMQISRVEAARLSEILAVPVPGYRFMPAYRAGRWDGKRHFYRHGRFPSGFLPFIVKTWRALNRPIHAVDDRKLPHPLPVPQTDGLRDYQAAEVEKVFETMIEIDGQVIPWIRGVIRQPTGSGKSHVAGALIRSIGLPALYIVERLDLLYQTADILSGYCKSVGVIGDQQREIADVIVATIQTLSRLDLRQEDWLARIGTLVVDEAHHVSDNRYWPVVMACPAPYRFGISATPLVRGDLGDVMLIGSTGDIISDVPRQPLEEAGWLAKPRVMMVRVDQPYVDDAADWQSAYNDLLVANPVRNHYICQAIVTAVRRDLPVLVLVRLLAHGEMLRALLNRMGIQATWLHGERDARERRRALCAFGKVGGVLIASTIFDEGVDSTAPRVLILAGGGASRIKTIQRVGRGLRPKQGGENTLLVIDFDDQTNRYLAEHSARRREAFIQEGLPVELCDWPSLEEVIEKWQ